jgi:diadenosine tetraphosphate (Ap4A) HIT family hydrolase
MSAFAVDKELLQNCQQVAEADRFSYLLHQNAEVVWFILVPHTNVTELYQLETDLQQQVYQRINRLSDFIQSHFSIDKINVASIGNVVSQLHIHVIGRRLDDVYWPDVVWGKKFEKKRESTQISLISTQLSTYLSVH